MHNFELKGEWKGALNGAGQLQVGLLNQLISVPKDMGGQGIGTNPEELMLAAASSCFMISLAAIFQFRKLAFQEICLKSVGHYQMGITGPSLVKIEHHVQVVVGDKNQTIALEPKLTECFKNAEQSCMIARALKNNVAVVVQGELYLREAV